ncbi:response regulator transcription factor [Thiocapsa rosea]|uniref:DNA-binding response OmpR family regulator n=1 Tax=Thiocapsa rosea TaxID=69360 RepID=A0A495V8P9_9GAMM|nr:response regulator transcription factor [Thiocapsa rosea]RKT45781.1 DNA-binding response OmpR family regulator [Thiocapsa rosea]
MNILLVEDEARVADFVQRGLKAEGWSVSVAPTGELALVMIADAYFDVIVLDLMLPGISGQDVCRRLRAKKNRTPILMLSALADVEDRVAGLRMGADDYLPKPFDFDELMARIEALARRSVGFEESASAPHVLTSGALSFDTRSLEVRCGDTPINLTPKERDLVKLFLGNPRKIFSRERILSTLWGINEDPQTNVVDVYIGRLRKKLGPCGEPIETVRGAGYRYAENGPG